MSLFLAADACLSWSLPSITEQQVSLHRLPMQYWLENHRLSSNTPRTPTVFLIQQSCIIIKFRCLVICAHAYMRRKNGVIKEAIVLQWAVRIALCDFNSGTGNGLVHCSVKNAAVLCKNHRGRVTQSWTRWMVGCYNGLQVSCFGDFEKFVCITIHCVSAPSLHI